MGVCVWNEIIIGCRQNGPLAIADGIRASDFNADLIVATGPMTFESNDKWDGDGKVLFRWLPMPHIRFELALKTQLDPMAVLRFSVTGGGFSRVGKLHFENE